MGLMDMLQHKIDKNYIQDLEITENYIAIMYLGEEIIIS